MTSRLTRHQMAAAQALGGYGNSLGGAQGWHNLLVALAATQPDFGLRTLIRAAVVEEEPWDLEEDTEGFVNRRRPFSVIPAVQDFAFRLAYGENIFIDRLSLIHGGLATPSRYWRYIRCLTVVFDLHLDFNGPAQQSARANNYFGLSLTALTDATDIARFPALESLKLQADFGGSRVTPPHLDQKLLRPTLQRIITEARQSVYAMGRCEMLVALTDVDNASIKTNASGDEIVHSVSRTHASSVAVLVRDHIAEWYIVRV